MPDEAATGVNKRDQLRSWPDVKKLWEQASQDPSFDRERREIARGLVKLGVRVNRR